MTSNAPSNPPCPFHDQEPERHVAIQHLVMEREQIGLGCVMHRRVKGIVAAFLPEYGGMGIGCHDCYRKWLLSVDDWCAVLRTQEWHGICIPEKSRDPDLWLCATFPGHGPTHYADDRDRYFWPLFDHYLPCPTCNARMALDYCIELFGYQAICLQCHDAIQFEDVFDIYNIVTNTSAFPPAPAIVDRGPLGTRWSFRCLDSS